VCEALLAEDTLLAEAPEVGSEGVERVSRRSQVTCWVMRRGLVVAAIVLACLAVSACGKTTAKTVTVAMATTTAGGTSEVAPLSEHDGQIRRHGMEEYA
jgi:hypothetical protein